MIMSLGLECLLLTTYSGYIPQVFFNCSSLLSTHVLNSITICHLTLVTCKLALNLWLHKLNVSVSITQTLLINNIEDKQSDVLSNLSWHRLEIRFWCHFELQCLWFLFEKNKWMSEVTWKPRWLIYRKTSIFESSSEQTDIKLRAVLSTFSMY